MKNRKLAAVLFCAAFGLGISATGCAQKEQESRGQDAGEVSGESGKAGESDAGSADAGGNAEGEAAGSADEGGSDADMLEKLTFQELEFGDLKEFEAMALDGSTFTQDIFADKDITAINFWALTCSPCLAEMPELAEIGKALPDNVQLMTVCLDGYGNEEYVKYVMEQTGFEGTTLLGGDGDLLEFCMELQYTPTTVFVDSEGNTVGDAIVGGRADLAEVYESYINGALTEMGKEEISIETGAE